MPKVRKKTDKGRDENHNPLARRIRTGCLRCGILGLKCSITEAVCPNCARAAVECVPFLLNTVDVLMKQVPRRNINKGNQEDFKYESIYGNVWRRFAGADHIVNEAGGGLPLEAGRMTRNPLRLAGPDTEQDDESDGESLPLPTSAVLDLINKSVARADIDAGEPEVLAERMGPSALLAMGIVLQEYTRFALESPCQKKG